jgi:hypothetical protein
VTRTRRGAEIASWAAIVMNGGVLVFDLATGRYHLAAGIAVVLFGLVVARHILEQSDRRFAARLSRAESEASRADYEQQTAAYVLAQIKSGAAQVIVEGPHRPH